jgi:hypothetical protein
MRCKCKPLQINKLSLLIFCKGCPIALAMWYRMLLLLLPSLPLAVAPIVLSPPPIQPAVQQAGHEEEKDEEAPPHEQAPLPCQQAPPPTAPHPPPPRVTQDEEQPPPPLPPSPPPPAPEKNPLPHLAALNPSQAAYRRRATAVALLRATPRVPAIPAKLPLTWPALVGK